MDGATIEAACDEEKPGRPLQHRGGLTLMGPLTSCARLGHLQEISLDTCCDGCDASCSCFMCQSKQIVHAFLDTFYTSDDFHVVI